MTQYYFENEDATTCYPLEDHIVNAKEEGLTEITLLEAIPDNDNPDYIWCTHDGDVVDRGDCKKSVCSYYESKSGRGKCRHRGSLYQHGEPVTFKVE